MYIIQTMTTNAKIRREHNSDGLRVIVVVRSYIRVQKRRKPVRMLDYWERRVWQYVQDGTKSQQIRILNIDSHHSSHKLKNCAATPPLFGSAQKGSPCRVLEYFANPFTRLG